MTNGDSSGTLITAEEVSKILQLPLASVWRLARIGVFPSYRAGRLLRFDLEEVKAAMRASPQARPSAARCEMALLQPRETKENSK